MELSDSQTGFCITAINEGRSTGDGPGDDIQGLDLCQLHESLTSEEGLTMETRAGGKWRCRDIKAAFIIGEGWILAKLPRLL